MKKKKSCTPTGIKAYSHTYLKLAIFKEITKPLKYFHVLSKDREEKPRNNIVDMAMVHLHGLLVVPERVTEGQICSNSW